MNKRSFNWIAIAVILLSLLSACTQAASTPPANTPTAMPVLPTLGPTQTTAATQTPASPTVEVAKPTNTLASLASPSAAVATATSHIIGLHTSTPVGSAATAVNAVLYNKSCSKLNWHDKSAEYKQSDGTYLVPLKDLEVLAGGQPSHLILFEGVETAFLGEHHNCALTGDSPTCNREKSSKTHAIQQGEYWVCEVTTDLNKGYTSDVQVQVQSFKKWLNDQATGSIRTYVQYLSTGVFRFENGTQPTVPGSDKVKAEYNDCGAYKKPVEQTPYAPEDQGNGLVMADPGALGCRTVFVGKLTTDGQMVAGWFTNSWDTFTYVNKDAHFFLIPATWGITEMKTLVLKYQLVLPDEPMR